MLKITYKGRSFSSAKALTDAMTRSLKDEYERKIRRAAQLSGLSVRKTTKGLEVSGDAPTVERFSNRLGR
jgi:hypothetical protein